MNVSFCVILMLYFVIRFFTFLFFCLLSLVALFFMNLDSSHTTVITFAVYLV